MKFIIGPTNPAKVWARVEALRSSALVASNSLMTVACRL